MKYEVEIKYTVTHREIVEASSADDAIDKVDTDNLESEPEYGEPDVYTVRELR